MLQWVILGGVRHRYLLVAVVTYLIRDGLVPFMPNNSLIAVGVMIICRYRVLLIDIIRIKLLDPILKLLL